MKILQNHNNSQYLIMKFEQPRKYRSQRRLYNNGSAIGPFLPLWGTQFVLDVDVVTCSVLVGDKKQRPQSCELLMLVQAGGLTV